MSNHLNPVDATSEPPAGEVWELWLYVVGETPKSARAFASLKQVCDEHLAGRYRIEMIDLLEEPRLAREHQIVAIPTVVRKLPLPVRTIIGNLYETILDG